MNPRPICHTAMQEMLLAEMKRTPGDLLQETQSKLIDAINEDAEKEQFRWWIRLFMLPKIALSISCSTSAQRKELAEKIEQVLTRLKGDPLHFYFDQDIIALA
jgi:hypothetical protein